MINRITKILCLYTALILLVGCSGMHSDSNTLASNIVSDTTEDKSMEHTASIDSSIKQGNKIVIDDRIYIYAEDTDGDGNIDAIDTDNDGILDINNTSCNIDTDCGQVSDFSLTSIDGNTYDNAYLAEHDLNIVIIWGYWCPDCMYELYHLSNYYDAESQTSADSIDYLGDLPDNIGIFGITIGSAYANASNPARFEDIIMKYSDIYGISFDNVLAISEDATNLCDSIRLYKTESRDYSGTVPAVALIDSHGNIIEVIYEGSAEQIVREIENNL